MTNHAQAAGTNHAVTNHAVTNHAVTNHAVTNHAVTNHAQAGWPPQGSRGSTPHSCHAPEPQGTCNLPYLGTATKRTNLMGHSTTQRNMEVDCCDMHGHAEDNVEEGGSSPVTAIGDHSGTDRAVVIFGGALAT